MKKPTIKDIAKKAGVGIGTVSRVINNSGYVAEETRKRIEAAIEELGYQPDPTARGLVSGSTGMISIVVPMIRTEFYDRLVEAIDGFLAVNSYDTVIFPLLSKRRLQRFSSRSAFLYRTDGIIMASMPVHKLFENGEVPTDRPVVLIDMYSNKYDSIYIDNLEIGKLAANILLEHTTNLYVLTFIEPETVFTSDVFKKRVSGFQKLLRDRGIELTNSRIFHSELDLHYAFSQAMQILKKIKKFPAGIFAACDLFGYGIILAAKNLGIEIGKDLFVVGVDDQSWSEDIGLTTIRQPVEEMSTMATEILLHRITKGKAYGKQKKVNFDPIIIRRASA
ncbi:MAG: LacI family DNA-binding transcriptional regulator [Kosmotoga sp.]|uniref:LacI family DNA-binding transcriptional regulator n=1 Tax=Kosmotoga sp. TaxID=1955248 RepID=UPI001DA94486|nr:LacI family DNA-binding transcriptional regulator [Kosmotoga sp.]MBO8167013.1 LacI family DNA-binding transcriptional regulator [Kosmotoga sp.]